MSSSLLPNFEPRRGGYESVYYGETTWDPHSQKEDIEDRKILMFGVNRANIEQGRYLKTGKFSKRCLDFR